MHFYNFRVILFSWWLYAWAHRRNLAITWIWVAGENRPWVLGTVIYERVKSEGREEWFDHPFPRLLPHFFISSSSTQ